MSDPTEPEAATDHFVHPLADVASTKIGSRTRIWQFCVILSGAELGGDCNVCSHVFIENDVIVGHRVTIKNGVQLWDGLRVADDVFIGPNVTFSNDRYPASGRRPDRFEQTFLEQGASIGAGAVLVPGIRIGAGALIAAGAVVTKNVPPMTLVAGNPARFVRDVLAGEAWNRR